MINDDPGDIELLSENERHRFHAYLERFRLNKRGAAELGIVGDGELVGANAAREDAQAQIADFHRPSQNQTEFRLNLGTEIVDVHQQGDGDGNDNQYGDDNTCNFEAGFHDDTS